MMSRSDSYNDLYSHIEQLNAIGIALSAEKNVSRLLETILIRAKEITQSDGGTLYTVHEDGKLHFEVVRTTSLGIKIDGAGSEAEDFEPIPLHMPDRSPNDHMVVAYAALHNETVNIPDVYQEASFDFSGPRNFDKRTGYRSKSFLAVPMKNHENDIIGVLQLINKQDNEKGVSVPFSRMDQQLAESLASQAAVALTNRKLIDSLSKLFNAFIKTIAAAIDEKSEYTSGHCNRVPVLSKMLADAVCRTERGPMKDFTMSDDERYALEVASWLHDCGKVTTPEYVVDKATKLETIFDRIHLIDTRFEVLKRDARIHTLERIIQADPGQREAIEEDYRRDIDQIEADRAFLHKCNAGGEHMQLEDQQHVKNIGARTWVNCEDKSEAFLSENEMYNLQVSRGTLTAEERDVINNHIVVSIKMLDTLPFPRYMEKVPEYAGGHHERMDGTGYPNGLTREQMSIPARIMAIADIFEALTAADRPYKKAKPLSETLKILGFMKLSHHIDPDLFDVFINEKLYLDYARKFMASELIDIKEPNEIPGYPFTLEENELI